MSPAIHRHHYTMMLVLAVSLALLARAVWQPALTHSIDVWGFVLLALAAEALPVELPRGRGTVSVSFPIIFAGAMIFGPAAGIFVGIIGTVQARELTGAVPWQGVLLNRLQLGLAGGLSGVVYATVSRWNGPLAPWLALILGGTTYFVINAGSVALMLSLFYKVPLWSFVRTTMMGAVASYLALIPVTYVMMAAYKSVGFPGLVLFFLPLLVARHSFQMYTEVRRSYDDMVRALADALEARDSYTAGHAERVGQIAMGLGRALGLSEDRLELIGLAGLLHDIGKIAVPDRILNKKNRLTGAERATMRRHPVIGYGIVRHIKFLEDGVKWVRHHHEQWDGTGYPEGLKGEEIPLGARIIAVADSLDAMLSDRPYRMARRLVQAAEELSKNSGTQYDPKIIETFLRLCADRQFVNRTLRQPAPLSPETVERLLAVARESEARAHVAAASAVAEQERPLKRYRVKRVQYVLTRKIKRGSGVKVFGPSAGQPPRQPVPETRPGPKGGGRPGGAGDGAPDPSPGPGAGASKDARSPAKRPPRAKKARDAGAQEGSAPAKAADAAPASVKRRHSRGDGIG